MSRTARGSVPVLVAAKVYGKDPAWVRAGIISGWLPIGTATRAGKKVTSVDDMNSKYGRINYYISPQLLFEQTGFKWKGVENMRSELSENSRWHLNKHRFLELKHYCLQYPEWKKFYTLLSNGGTGSVPIDRMIFKTGIPSDPTAANAIAATSYKDRMDLIESTAKDTCADLWSYIFEGVTSGKGYEELSAPCSKETYYDNYRKFFALLHIRRG